MEHKYITGNLANRIMARTSIIFVFVLLPLFIIFSHLIIESNINKNIAKDNKNQNIAELQEMLLNIKEGDSNNTQYSLILERILSKQIEQSSYLDELNYAIIDLTDTIKKQNQDPNNESIAVILSLVDNIKDVSLINSYKIDYLLDDYNSAISRLISKKDPLILDTNNTDDNKDSNTDTLEPIVEPFKLRSIEIWNGEPQAVISVDDKDSIVEVGDQRLGWIISNINFDAEIIEIINNQNSEQKLILRKR